MKTVVMPSFKNDIVTLRNERKMWDVIATVCSVLAVIFGGITVALISLEYHTTSLIFSASAVSLQSFVHVSNSQSHIKTTHLNSLLSQLGISPMFKNISSTITPSVGEKLPGKYLSQQQVKMLHK